MYRVPDSGTLAGGLVEHCSNVPDLEDAFHIAVPGNRKHRQPNLLCGQNMVGERAPKQGHDGFGCDVDDPVGRGLRSRSVQGLNEARAKHVSGREGQAEERILCFPLNPRPHPSATLGAVGAGAGDVEEFHIRVEPA